MEKEDIELFRLEFFHHIDQKPSFGRNQIKELFIISLNNVLLKNISFNKDNKN